MENQACEKLHPAPWPASWPASRTQTATLKLQHSTAALKLQHSNGSTQTVNFNCEQYLFDSSVTCESQSCKHKYCSQFKFAI